jgi:DNA-directed RNA polymerase specialized sigma24 family protein
MDELNQELQSLINLACSHPPTSPEHRKALDSLFTSLLQSRRVWKSTSDLYDLYEEALSEAMLSVSQELCRTYDSSRSPFLVWFNTCLRNKFIDKVRAEQREHSRRQRGEVDPLDAVAAGFDAALLLKIWESFAQWLEDDPDGVLFDCHVERNPQANCQSLAKRKILQGQEWQEIAQVIGVKRGTITSHWCRKCQPLIQKWFDENQQLFGGTNHD